MRKRELERALNIKHDEITELNYNLNLQRNNNTRLAKTNAGLTEENKNLKDLVARVTRLLNCNKYNNPEAILNKIKELVRDYQSKN